jgi:hypothetical protein
LQIAPEVLMRFFLAVFLSVLILFPMPTGSAQRPNAPDISTTQGFLAYCGYVDRTPDVNNPVEMTDWGYCAGFVLGFTYGFESAEWAYHLPAGFFCRPDELTPLQNVHIIRKFIADHPEMEHLPTQVVAMRALSEAFPCHQ